MRKKQKLSVILAGVLFVTSGLLTGCANTDAISQEQLDGLQAIVDENQTDFSELEEPNEKRGWFF